VPFAELVRVAFCHGNAVVWKIVSAPAPSAMPCAGRMWCQGVPNMAACCIIEAVSLRGRDAARLCHVITSSKSLAKPSPVASASLPKILGVCVTVDVACPAEP